MVTVVQMVLGVVRPGNAQYVVQDILHPPELAMNCFILMHLLVVYVMLATVARARGRADN